MANVIKNQVLQIDADQHLSEERVIVNYVDDQEPDAPLSAIVNVSDLEGADATLYADFKAMITSKIV